MTVKLLTKHHFEFLILKGGCTGLYESTLDKLPHWWKSHVTSHLVLPRGRYSFSHRNKYAYDHGDGGLIYKGWFLQFILYLAVKSMHIKKTNKSDISLYFHCSVGFFGLPLTFSIRLMHFPSELQTPKTFLFVNENIKCMWICIFLVRTLQIYFFLFLHFQLLHFQWWNIAYNL